MTYGDVSLVAAFDERAVLRDYSTLKLFLTTNWGVDSLHLWRYRSILYACGHASPFANELCPLPPMIGSDGVEVEVSMVRSNTTRVYRWENGKWCDGQPGEYLELRALYNAIWMSGQ